MRKLLVLLVLLFPLSVQTIMGQEQESVLAVEWVDLLSPADLDAMLNPPNLIHDGYGWEEQLEKNGDDDAYIKALQSVDVNSEFVNKRIMIPGFIVPTAYNEARKVTEFFLVPFFGACIHLPPPPPNQIIYVTYDRGVELVNFYDAHVIHGRLTSEVVRNDMATSAYRIEAEGVSIYSY